MSDQPTKKTADSGSLRLDDRVTELKVEINSLKKQLTVIDDEGSSEYSDLDTRLKREKKTLKVAREQIKAAKKMKAIWDSYRAKGGRPYKKQAEMAEEMGVSPSLVSAYMNGRQGMNAEWILKFAKYLGVEPSEISPYLSNRIGVDSFVDHRISDRLKSCSPDFKKAMLKLLETHISENS